MAISVNFNAEIQSGTQGDTISIALVDFAGNPLSLTAVFAAFVAMEDPTGNVIEYPATINVATSTISILTQTTMLNSPGIWTAQPILNYSGGGVSKGSKLELSVDEALA